MDLHSAPWVDNSTNHYGGGGGNYLGHGPVLQRVWYDVPRLHTRSVIPPPLCLGLGWVECMTEHGVTHTQDSLILPPPPIQLIIPSPPLPPPPPPLAPQSPLAQSPTRLRTCYRSRDCHLDSYVAPALDALGAIESRWAALFGGRNTMDALVEPGDLHRMFGTSEPLPRCSVLCDLIGMDSVAWVETCCFGLPFESQSLGFPRDLTQDGDVESNPGPDLWCGQISANAWGTRIMSLHEDLEVVDRWVWELAFVSNQRVISLPVRRWSLLRWDSDYVLGIWLWMCSCTHCGRIFRVARGGHGLIYDHMSSCRSDWSLRNEPPRVRECLGWARFHRFRDRARRTELIRAEYEGMREFDHYLAPEGLLGVLDDSSYEGGGGGALAEAGSG